MTQEAWGTVRQNLKRVVGANAFTAWIEPLEFDDARDGVASFSAPTAYVGNYVDRNFGDDILFGLRREGIKVERVTFEVSSELARRAAVRVNDEADEAEGEEAVMELTSARLDPRHTFDKFIVGKPNEMAFAAAKRVAEGRGVVFNPLFLYGGVGLGKTHLMQAIAWELRELRPDLNVVYLSAEQFMYRFIQALRERKMMDFKLQFRNADVLIVDDVQFIAGKDSTQEEFF
ncbi:MAG: DnaA/Hda family protein, partial [Pseudomonadota bacterium]